MTTAVQNTQRHKDTTMQQLNVLVVESDNGAANAAIAALQASGHRTHRCHPEHAASFPCNGFGADDACPLREHAIDVAITVRTHGDVDPTEREAGLLCAREHDIPIVVVGRTQRDRFARFAATFVDRSAEVVSTCEHAARPGSNLDANVRVPEPEVVAAVSAIVQTECGPTTAAEVEIVQEGADVIVEVRGEVPLRLRRLVANRIIGRVHNTSRSIASIDVAYR
mgnify:FL=1